MCSRTSVCSNLYSPNLPKEAPKFSVGGLLGLKAVAHEDHDCVSVITGRSEGPVLWRRRPAPTPDPGRRGRRSRSGAPASRGRTRSPTAVGPPPRAAWRKRDLAAARPKRPRTPLGRRVRPGAPLRRAGSDLGCPQRRSLLGVNPQVLYDDIIVVVANAMVERIGVGQESRSSGPSGQGL
jgi:hypothetical protein